MGLSNVGNVVHLSNPDVVDKYLDAGWALLFVGQYMGEDTAYITHVLGWAKDAGEPVRPEQPGQLRYLDD